MHWSLLIAFFFFLNAVTFRGIIGQTHGVNVKRSQQIHYIVLKEQFDMCLLSKMYILDQR